jgi:hypothetical protein
MIRSRSLDILRLLRAASLLLLVIAFSARSELRAIPATSRQFLRRTLPRALAKYIFLDRCGGGVLDISVAWRWRSVAIVLGRR